MNPYKGKYFFPEIALSILLDNNICFLNTAKYELEDNSDCGITTVVFVNANDLFYQGAADGVDIKKGEIQLLYDSWVNNPKWGIVRWCCQKMNQRPHDEIIAKMKVAKEWDSQMEQLPK